MEVLLECKEGIAFSVRMSAASSQMPERAGKAYVCHQTGAEIKASREALEASPWRERPTSESLKLFEDMRRCDHG